MRIFALIEKVVSDNEGKTFAQATTDVIAYLTTQPYSGERAWTIAALGTALADTIADDERPEFPKPREHWTKPARRPASRPFQIVRD